MEVVSCPFFLLFSSVLTIRSRFDFGLRDLVSLILFFILLPLSGSLFSWYSALCLLCPLYPLCLSAPPPLPLLLFRLRGSASSCFRLRGSGLHSSGLRASVSSRFRLPCFVLLLSPLLSFSQPPPGFVNGRPAPPAAASAALRAAGYSGFLRWRSDARSLGPAASAETPPRPSEPGV